MSSPVSGPIDEARSSPPEWTRLALSHPVSSLIGDSLACISDRLQLSLAEMWAIGADGTGHLVHRSPLKGAASDKGTCDWAANAPVLLPIPLVAALVGDPRGEDPFAPIPFRRVRVGNSDEERVYREAGLQECIWYAVLVDERPEALFALWLRPGQEWGSNEESLASVLAAQIARTVSLARELQQCERGAALDDESIRTRLWRRLQLVHSLSEFSSLLFQYEVLEQGLEVAAPILALATGADRVNILRVQPDTKLVHFVSCWCRSGIPDLRSVNPGPFSSDDFPEITSTLAAGRHYAVRVSQTRGADREINEKAGTKAYLLVPIILHSQLWGALNLDDCTAERNWTDGELEMLRCAAAFVASAIDRKSSREEADTALAAERRRVSEAREEEVRRFNIALNEATSKLSGSMNIDAYLDHIVSLVSSALHSDASALYIFDSVHRTLVPKAGVLKGHVSPYLDGTHPITPESPLRNPVMPPEPLHFDSKLQTFLVPEDEWILTPEVCRWHMKHGHQSIVSASVQIGETAIGFLTAAFTHRNAISPDAMQLLLALTNQAAVAIRLADLGRAAEQKAVLEERNRLAREIHDTLAHSFVGILMQIEAARESSGQGAQPGDAVLSILESIARSGLEEARRSVAALRPFPEEQIPLAERITELLNRFRTETTVEAELTVRGTPVDLQPGVALELTRIAQESLNNVAKHARASKVELDLEFHEGNSVQLSIRDDGAGFDPKIQRTATQYGLVGMSERAERIGAELSITSEADAGTVVSVVLRTTSFNPVNP